MPLDQKALSAGTTPRREWYSPKVCPTTRMPGRCRNRLDVHRSGGYARGEPKHGLDPGACCAAESPQTAEAMGARHTMPWESLYTTPSAPRARFLHNRPASPYHTTDALRHGNASDRAVRRVYLSRKLRACNRTRGERNIRALGRFADTLC